MLTKTERVNHKNALNQSTVTNVNYWALARRVMPFVVVEIIVLLMLVLVPEITLWLPRVSGLWH